MERTVFFLARVAVRIAIIAVVMVVGNIAIVAAERLGTLDLVGWRPFVLGGIALLALAIARLPRLRFLRTK